MKGRITRDHDARQGYDRVYFEGGSAITDADLNAGFDAERARTEALHAQWIAPAGSPDDGWKVGDLGSFALSGQTYVDFTLAPGHYGLDGQILTNPASYRFSDQPAAQAAALDPHLRLRVPTLAEVQAAPGDALYDAVVLDATAVPVRVTEDSELDEVAIRSDPATRGIMSAKVRAIRDVDAQCALARRAMMDLLAAPNGSVTPPSPRIVSEGRLQITFGAVPAPDNPCAPDMALGYFGRLNHTIKVMLTAPDRFVWGYRNGEGLYRATITDATTLRLVTPFAENGLFPVAGQIVELCAWDMVLPNGEKTARPLGQFHAIRTGYAPEDETLTLDTPITADLMGWYNERVADGDDPYLFLRFWEPAATAMDSGTATGAAVRLAETGLVLNFTAAGNPGDHWTFSLRVNANDTVYPKRMLDPGGKPPDGPHRSADLLALIHWSVVGGTVVGHVHDCRQRVRPLWKQRDCCTFKVGDGLTSFGDFDTIQQAIDALPHEGGRICLLPGRHPGGARLLGRENVTITGCGRRSMVLSSGTDDPAFQIEDCVAVTLKDMLILDDTSLAIGGARNRGLTLDGVTTRGRGSAIALFENEVLRIRACRFLAETEPAIIPPADFAALRPLAVVGGGDLEIRDCEFLCAPGDLSLQSLGGLQVASDSLGIWIENNVISGGIGHGLTLGHVTKLKAVDLPYGKADDLRGAAGTMRKASGDTAVWRANGRSSRMTAEDLVRAAGTEAAGEAIKDIVRDAVLVLEENAIEVATVAIQGCLGIDPTVPQTEPQDDEPDWESYFVGGDVVDIHIVDNRISDMGGSGIATPAWNISTRPAFGTLHVAGLVIDRNHISDCCRVAVATTLRPAEIQEIGFGGIALDYVAGARISGNLIERIGLDVRTPSVGIYLREVVNGHIHNNVLRAIGRIERSENLNISGISGGIIVDQCRPEYGDPSNLPLRERDKMGMREVREKLSGRYDNRLGYAEEVATTAETIQLPRGTALLIQNNAVVVNFGMSLDIRGAGSMQVTDNHLTSLGNRVNPLRARLGSNINVVNTDVPYLEVLTYIIAILKAVETFISDYAFSTIILRQLAKAIYRLSYDRHFEVIQFNDNHTHHENFVPEENRPACTAIISPYDIQVSDNAMKSVNLDTSGAVHLLGAGYYSTQCYANRIDTRPSDGVYAAAITIGLGNTTLLNHASQQILTVAIASAMDGGDGNLTP
ncbi:right-handed parallel beta-helix repeat-containing protein [Yoonia vestfoldensis]|uniref:right-handed parallel beta-helix repeat-containing protein n=1 Tax=Yoonia vestfoldensis TaxID=245188 RepID=UPI00037BCB91|nr:right-handed parallel beta-helix repeat-containing protein [Yoonia vestfoldensis]